MPAGRGRPDPCPFDFLSFSYEKRTVGLYGYAYHPGLKTDAGRAVKRASRVDQVVNKIEDLPPSLLDDDLWWQVYYAIYRAADGRALEVRA
jgi:hypothetical protein